MMNWLRQVVPDLFLAAVVALVVMLAIKLLDGQEVSRIHSDRLHAAEDGITIDEHIELLDESIRRSTLIHLPLLIAVSGAVVGLACRNRRWAWLTALGSVVPALIMGVAYFIDRPIAAGTLTSAYALLAITTSLAASALRSGVLSQGAR